MKHTYTWSTANEISFIKNMKKQKARIRYFYAIRNRVNWGSLDKEEITRVACEVSMQAQHELRKQNEEKNNEKNYDR